LAGRSVYQLESRHCFAPVAAFCCLETGKQAILGNATFKPIANRSNRSGLFAPRVYRKPLWLVRFGLEGRPTAAITLSRKTRFLVLSQRLKRHDHNPQWRVGNFGEITMCTRSTTVLVVKIPARSNLASAMSEAQFDRLLDAVRTAIEPAPIVWPGLMTR
jgi:hypothetical protein